MDARRTALNIIQRTVSGNTPLNFIAVRVEESAETWLVSPDEMAREYRTVLCSFTKQPGNGAFKRRSY